MTVWCLGGWIYPKKSPIRGGSTGRGSLYGVRDYYPAKCPSLVRCTGVVAGVNDLIPTYHQFVGTIPGVVGGTCCALASSKQSRKGIGAPPHIHGPLP